MMRFPRQIGVLLLKIALERIMSPERTEELFREVNNAADEIKLWRKLTGSPSQEELSEPDQVIDEALEVRRIHGLSTPASLELREDVIDFAKRIGKRIEEVIETQHIEAEEVRAIVDSELPGRANTFVIWIDLDEIVTGAGGRFVHFSWAKSGDRTGFRVRDFIGGRITFPADKPETDKTWIHNPTDLTADQIWKSAKHRIATIKANGLGENDLGSVVKRRDVWKAVMNALTKNPPHNLPTQGTS